MQILCVVNIWTGFLFLCEFLFLESNFFCRQNQVVLFLLCVFVVSVCLV